ncbi:MAG: hypothetical protein AVO39_10165 [delta proteobacterium MLS_D]|nr:MAG: hypothetical protein AVO39_10165 [delta proteobacterium MLS_D]
MIYTASFFERKYWGAGEGRLVSIAMDMPDGYTWNYHGFHITENELLKPEWWLVNGFKSGNILPKGYKREYFTILKGRFGENWGALYRGFLGPGKALEVMELEDGDRLLCWEGYGTFCHRILVAELLRKNGIEVRRR